MKLVVKDKDMHLWNGDALETLSQMPSGSIDCCVSSPPYWRLRDYGHEMQVGLEGSLEEYLERLVRVFAEVKRVLVDAGTLWLNIGDSYSSTGSRGFGTESSGLRKGRLYEKDVDRQKVRTEGSQAKIVDGLKSKDLIGVPWRLAFALQADGWFLRSDIIWEKPNAMPSSVTDRPTMAHEYIFLLSKSSSYYFDQDSLREPYGDRPAGNHERSSPDHVPTAVGRGVPWKPAKKVDSNALTLGDLEPEAPRGPDGRRKTGVKGAEGSIQHRDGERWPNEGGRNVRSVWRIVTQPFPGGHFAVFPEELARRCIVAGSPEGGTVIDPFLGSGTTALVARKNNRRSIGIELNPSFCEMAAARVAQQSLLA